MPHTWWFLVLDALATYRLTRLLVHDTVFAWLRDAEVRVGEWLLAPGDLLHCDWCVSVWMAALVVGLTAAWPHLWLYAAAGLAFSAVTGILSERL